MPVDVPCIVNTEGEIEVRNVLRACTGYIIICEQELVKPR